MVTQQPLRVCIIYAHEDEPYRLEIAKHLLTMERAGMILVWTDRELLAGDEWEPSIKEKLKSADIILLLVSSDYFNNYNVHKVEIKEALLRHESGEAIVIPIIVRPCLWEKDPIISRMQVLPSNFVAVSVWLSRDDAWLDIAKEIDRIIKQAELEKANREHEKREKIEHDRLVIEEAEHKQRKMLAQKQREQLKKIERERLFAEQEELKHQAWRGLLECPTIEAYQDYLKTYPNHSFEKEIDNYPELIITHKGISYSRDFNETWKDLKKYSAWALGILFLSLLTEELSRGIREIPRVVELIGVVIGLGYAALLLITLVIGGYSLVLFCKIIAAKSAYKKQFRE